jgi:alkylhydroperoxidase/carboxymuconolactone decarboxylase family protein YurZ
VNKENQDMKESEVSLLDLLIVVAQNLRLLIVAPLLLGLLALGATYWLPKKYESVAIQSGDAQLLVIYNSAQVRDAVIQQINYSKGEEDLETARERLAKNLITLYSSKDKTIKISARATTPQGAQTMAQIAIQQAALLNQERSENVKRLRDQFELAINRERQYSQSAQRLVQQIQSSNAANQASLVQSQAQLLDAARSAQSTTADLADKINKADNYDLLQRPTLPTREVLSFSQRVLIAIAAAAVLGFALLIWFFIRQMVVNSNERDAAKLNLLSASLRSAVFR